MPALVQRGESMQRVDAIQHVVVDGDRSGELVTAVHDPVPDRIRRGVAREAGQGLLEAVGADGVGVDGADRAVVLVEQ